MSKKFRFFTIMIIMISVLLPSASAQAGNLTASYDLLFLIVTIISFVVFAIVLVIFIAFVLKFQEKKEFDREPLSHTRARQFEVGWTGLAVVITLILIFLSYPFLFALNDATATADPNAIEVIVEGTANWEWLIHIPSDNITATPVVQSDGSKLTTAQFKVGIAYNFVFWASGPWIHSFYSPELNFKMDVVPGSNNTMPVIFEEVGTYNVMCAEFCGAGHSQMRGVFEVTA